MKQTIDNYSVFFPSFHLLSDRLSIGARAHGENKANRKHQEVYFAMAHCGEGNNHEINRKKKMKKNRKE